MRDPNLLSIPEAALLLGEDPVKTRKRLAIDADFHEAVVFKQPDKFRVAISLPRLGRYVHGDEFALVRDDWRLLIADHRAQRVAS